MTPAPTPVRIGQAIRHYRKARRLTIAALASQAGVKWSTLGSWERGERAASPLDLWHLAGHLRVDLTDLLTYDPLHPTSWENMTA